ncbi:hypothetical protein D9758_003794 [Tetrapyrgos nigripes]|uniref:Calcium-transporting ATPase n=1 Tax=Tetrapyrgos nigripes TaxID=182062 RepID=A0A8H5LSB5_9AGAR|nr:hypothetical protein D9758_003794 [Tetrapyrgos nigripes]
MLGLGDGSVLLYRHLDQSLASSTSLTALPKPRTVHETPTEPITGLGFRSPITSTSNPPQVNGHFRDSTASLDHHNSNLYLFVVTTNHVLVYQASGKGSGSSAVAVDEIGCGLGCAVMDSRSFSKEMVIARDEAIYMCGVEGRGNAFAYEGPKSSVHAYHSYLVIVSPPIVPSASAASATVRNFARVAESSEITKLYGVIATVQVTVFDPANKIVAYTGTFTQGVREVIVAPWGGLYVLGNNGEVTHLVEKPTSEKLEMLYRRSMFGLATNLAQTQGLDDSSVADIHRQYGDHLYSKGDYDGAMNQYLKTMGWVQPSYVIRKFLDAQRIHNLVTYLQELHSQGLANSDHTTLLLNTYTKLKDVSRLDTFIKTESKASRRSGGETSDELPFDLDTAIRVCRQAGYFEHAGYLAKKYERHEEYLRIQIEDAEQYEDALAYLRELGAEAAESNLARYGRGLLANLPEDTTQLLIDLCTISEAPVEVEGETPESPSKPSGGYLSYLNINRNSIVAQTTTSSETATIPAPSIHTVRPGDTASTRNSVHEGRIGDVNGSNHDSVTGTPRTASPPPVGPLQVSARPVKRLSPRVYFAHFVDHMEQFVVFLETVAARRWGQSVDEEFKGSESIIPPVTDDSDEKDQIAVWNTLLELYLTLPGFSSASTKPQDEKALRSKALRLLQSDAIPYDPTHALILCSSRGYTDGLVLLWEKMGMYEDVLRFWMDREAVEPGASVEVVKHLQLYGAKHPHLYPLVLRFLTSSSALLSKHQDDLKDILGHIDEEGIMPPLGIIQLLSRNDVASIGLVKNWLIERIQHERSEIQADQEWIQSYRMETAAKFKQVEELSDHEHPKVFHVTRCSGCGGQLDLPSVHFMCNHSYHQRCIVDHDTECPKCAREHGVIREIRKNNEQLADQHDLFVSEVREGGFKTLANGFSREVDDPASRPTPRITTDATLLSPHSPASPSATAVDDSSFITNVPPSPTISERSSVHYEPTTSLALRGNKPDAKGLSFLAPIEHHSTHGRKGSINSLATTTEAGTDPDYHSLRPSHEVELSQIKTNTTDATRVTSHSHLRDPSKSNSKGKGKDTSDEDEDEEGDPKSQRAELQQDVELNPTPFRFKPYELAHMLDPKSYEALRDIGGVKSLLRGLGVDPAKGLNSESSTPLTRVKSVEAKGGINTPGDAGSGEGASQRHDPNQDSQHLPAIMLTEPDGGVKAGVSPSPSAPSINAGVGDDGDDGWDEKGAFNASLADRRRVYGENVIPDRKSKSLLQLMWTAAKDKVLVLLGIAAVVSLALGLFQDFGTPRDPDEPPVDWVEGVAIVVAILIVVIVGSVNDWQKERQFKTLNDKKEERGVHVIRAGVEVIIDVKELVVGDIAILEPGEIIPCDGVLLSGHNVRCDESGATGESDAIRKVSWAEWTGLREKEKISNSDMVDPHSELAHTDCFVVSGSKILEGVGRYIVVAVGQKSFHGRIMMALRGDTENTPLQLKLNNLAELIAKLGSAAGLILFTALLIRFFVQLGTNDPVRTSSEKGIAFVNILIIAVTIIVVAVPEGLPLAVTLALSFATKRMTSENLLVRVLGSCETMANASVVCTDKTGTLTQNVMSVVAGSVGIHAKFVKNIKEHEGRTNANEPAGVDPGTAPKPSRKHDKDFSLDQSELNSVLSPQLQALFNESIAVNSTAFEDRDPSTGELVFVGSKTETALLTLAKELGWRDYRATRDELGNDDLVVQMLPFSSERKAMGVVVKTPNGKYRLHAKGAGEILSKRCTRHVVVGRPGESSQNGGEVETQEMDELAADNISRTIIFYANQMLRTISLCYRDLESWPPAGAELNEAGEVAWDDLARDMTLIGITGIEDPLRDGVTDAVAKCHHAGVSVKMVTGDNVLTARSIATQCGIFTKGGIIMEGPVFRQLSQPEMVEIVPRLQVLARSSPEDKKILVETLKHLGEIVGVTGDGTNDGPALKTANVGFSMGISGTEVAKEASDIILMDDNFASIVKAIIWGRCVNDSVRKFLQFQLSTNVTAVIITFVSAVASDQEESVLSAVQLLWINIIMDTFAALALATDPAHEGLLDRKPDRKTSPLFTTDMYKQILFQSCYQTAAILIFHFLGRQILGLENTEHNGDVVKTLVFNAFVFAQIFNSVNSRRLDKHLNIFEGILRNQWFIGITLLAPLLPPEIAVQILIVFVGGAAFQVTRVDGEIWGISLALGCVSIPLGALVRLLPNEPFERFFRRVGLLGKSDEELPTSNFDQEGWNGAISLVRDNLSTFANLRGGRLRSSSFVLKSRSARLSSDQEPLKISSLLTMAPTLIAGAVATQGYVQQGSLSDPASTDPSRSSAALWEGKLQLHPAMRYYEQKYPEVDELVMVQVRQIAEMGAYVKLLEYDNTEGMILLSELSRRRIRSVQKLIRVGRNEVVVVLRVDKEKGYIDLSKRRVSPEDITKCEERYMKSKTVASILRHVASKIPSLDADANDAEASAPTPADKESKKARRAARKAAEGDEIVDEVPVSTGNEEGKLEMLYETIAWPLGKTYGHPYDAFKLTLTEPDTVFSTLQTSMSPSVKSVLMATIARRLTPQPIKLRADIEVTCYTPAGIDAIKKALRAGEKESNEAVPIKVKLVAPPLYVLSTNATDKYAAVDRLERAIESIQSTIEEQGGSLVVKMKAAEYSPSSRKPCRRQTNKILLSSWQRQDKRMQKYLETRTTRNKCRLVRLHDDSRKQLLKIIQDDEMAPYYQAITNLPKSPLPLDSKLLSSLQEANAATLKTLDETLASAEATEGESEISDALKARANFLTRIGERDKAIEAQKLALEKTPGLGSRIDIVLTLIRIGFFWNDEELIVWGLDKAEKSVFRPQILVLLIEEGGDWDRRNRLKVYQGLHLLSIRQFKRAGELLLDALSTFTASELLEYNDFVALTIIAGALTLSRVDLKKKLIGSSEVNAALPDLPIPGDLVKNLYDCHYDKFFKALALLEQTHLLPSRLLSPHARYYVREMRILAYAQLLESYRSLTLESLGLAFGVTVEFVDNELSHFISTGRLHASIDKVHGIVETTKTSEAWGKKINQFEQVVRQGDVLLNELQRLSKVLY